MSQENVCRIKQYTGDPYGDLYQGITPTEEVVSVEAPYTEEEPKPVLVFNIMDCIIPPSKLLGDLFNSGFKLVATAYLSGAATLFFGVGSGGNMTVMGSTVAACGTFPCEGIVEVKWMIGREPTMSEFLQMLGFDPVPGTYEFDYSVGYMDGDTPVTTDTIRVTVKLTEGKDLSGFITPVVLSGLGSVMYMM